MTKSFILPLLLSIHALSLCANAMSSREPVRLLREGDVNIWINHGGTHPNSYKKFKNEIIYQIFVDRFSNGNSENDCIHNGRYCSDSDPYYYQGGDIRGVINKLDYLEKLGVNQIWLTPIFSNNQVRVALSGAEGAYVTSYHGYWINDWYRLNPYFTDRGDQDYEIVDELIRKSKTRGISVYMDTVFNHSSPSNAYPEDINYLESLRPVSHEANEASHLGVIFENGEYLTSYSEDLTRENNYNHFFHHYPTIGPNDWDNDYIVENYQLSGLADLNQTNSKILDYFYHASRFWLDRGIKGYRIDTIKHVNHSFWLDLSSKLSESHPESSHFGEYFGGGPSFKKSHKFFDETNFSMLDFEFREAIVDTIVKNGSFKKIRKYWQNDVNLFDARDLITYLDSHDLPRLRNDHNPISRKGMKNALALLLMSRGIPCLYYGIEQNLFSNQGSGDPYNRPMMKTFSESSDEFLLVSKLNKLRKENLSIRYGKTHIFHETDHILGFERVGKQQTALMIISKNPIPGSDKFKVKGLSFGDGEYTDVLSGKKYNIRGGEMPINLKSGEIIILSSVNN